MSEMRTDAAKVYRWLRDQGSGDVLSLATLFAPVTGRQAIRRVYEAVNWMRGQGVSVYAVADPLVMTRFALKADENRIGMLSGAVIPVAQPSRGLTPTEDEPEESFQDLYHPK